MKKEKIVENGKGYKPILLLVHDGLIHATYLDNNITEDEDILIDWICRFGGKDSMRSLVDTPLLQKMGNALNLTFNKGNIIDVLVMIIDSEYDPMESYDFGGGSVVVNCIKHSVWINSCQVEIECVEYTNQDLINVDYTQRHVSVYSYITKDKKFKPMLTLVRHDDVCADFCFSYTVPLANNSGSDDAVISYWVDKFSSDENEWIDKTALDAFELHNGDVLVAVISIVEDIRDCVEPKVLWSTTKYITIDNMQYKNDEDKSMELTIRDSSKFGFNSWLVKKVI